MIRIGKIVGCHGIKGELSLLPLTDDNRRFKKLEKAFLELPNGQYREVEILATREHKQSILLTIAGLEERTEAERWKNHYLCVKPEDAVKPKGAYFIYELIGLEVYQGEQYLGKLTEVMQNSSNDVYTVSGEQTIYLPALKSIVKEINLERGRMEVILPDGLLD